MKTRFVQRWNHVQRRPRSQGSAHNERTNDVQNRRQTDSSDDVQPHGGGSTRSAPPHRRLPHSQSSESFSSQKAEFVLLLMLLDPNVRMKVFQFYFRLKLLFLFYFNNRQQLLCANCHFDFICRCRICTRSYPAGGVTSKALCSTLSALRWSGDHHGHHTGSDVSEMMHIKTFNGSRGWKPLGWSNVLSDLRSSLKSFFFLCLAISCPMQV